jgi:flagellin-specific chaperone FliS
MDTEDKIDNLHNYRLRLLEFRAELEFLKIANKSQFQREVKEAWNDLVNKNRDKQLAQIIS